MTNLEWIRQLPAWDLAQYIRILQCCENLDEECHCSACLMFDNELGCSYPDEIEEWLNSECRRTLDIKEDN